MKNSVGLFLLVSALTVSAQTFPSVSVVATDPIATEPGPSNATTNAPDNGLFTITREGDTNRALLVFFTLGGTASNGVDYAKIDSTVTIPGGARAVRIPVVPLADDLVEGEERVILRLAPSPLVGPADGYILPTNSTAAVVVIRDASPTNPPPRTVVTIVATDPEGSEIPEVPPGLEIPQRYDPAVFTVTRTGILSNELTVFYAVGGTAANGVDYVKLPGELTIPAGAASANIEVSVIDDQLVEGTESVVIALLPVCVAIYPPPPECYLVGIPGRAEARILDNDVITNPPPRTVVSIVATDPEGSEIPVVPPGMGMPQRYDPAVFTVSRTGPTSNALTVSYLVGGTASNGIDYDFLPGKLEIPAGASSADIVVSVIDDFLVEGTESVTIRLIPPPCIAIVPPSPDCYVVGVATEARLLTFDDLSPGTEHFPLPMGYGGLDWYNFQVYNGSARPPMEGYYTGTVSPSNVIFNAYADPASIRSRDALFDLRSAYLTLALNLDNDLYIRVQGLSRGAIVYDNTYTVNRSGPTLAQFNYTGIDEARFIPSPAMQFAMDNVSVAVALPSFAEARILDNDFAPSNQPPAVAIVSPREGAQFKAPATVPITADTVDIDGYVSHVEFYANDFKIGEASKAFLIAPPPGEHISFDFEWKDARAGLYSLTARAFDDRGVVGISRPVRITIFGTNVPPNTNLAIVSITAPDAYASEHETNTATFLVRREGGTNHPLSVFYSIQGTASNGVDYLQLPGLVVIPAGERSARIVVTPINDEIPEPLESVIVSLLPPPVMNSLPQYMVGFPARAAAVIADDDSPRPPCICLRDGLFHWCRPATNGMCFRIECSTDLVTWSELCTATATEGAVLYVDADAPSIRMRFYRAIPVPCPEP